MKNIIQGILLAATMIVTAGCSDNATELWNEMPQKISEFVSRYFPGESVSKVVDNNGSFFVTVKNGPSIIFNKNEDWTSVNGNGETLPQMFLFDQLPPAVYSWLQDSGEIKDVFNATRDKGVYEVTLDNTYLRYDTATGRLTNPYK